MQKPSRKCGKYPTTYEIKCALLRLSSSVFSMPALSPPEDLRSTLQLQPTYLSPFQGSECVKKTNQTEAKTNENKFPSRSLLIPLLLWECRGVANNHFWNNRARPGILNKTLS